MPAVRAAPRNSTSLIAAYIRDDRRGRLGQGHALDITQVNLSVRPRLTDLSGGHHAFVR